MRSVPTRNVHGMHAGATITPGGRQDRIHQVPVHELSLAIESTQERLHSIHGKYSSYCWNLAWMNARQGFTQNGVPVLPSFLPVTGRFEVATRGHILSPKTLFLHFHLMPIPATFHASAVPQSLSEFFPYGGLDVIDIPFVLGTDEGVAEYACRAASLVGQLTENYVHVIVVITDHTDEKTGDLFLGPDETGCMVAGAVDEVSTFFSLCPTFLDAVHRFFVNCSRHSSSSCEGQ